MAKTKDQPTKGVSTANNPPAKGKKKFYLGGVSKKDILLFTKNLSILLKAGTTLSEAIKVLAHQAKGKLQDVLTQVTAQVEKGYQFSEALSKHPRIFSDIYVSMVKIGEQSGTLEQNLEHLADQLTKNYELRKKVLGAMMYPAVVLSGIIILGFSIAFFVLPKITRLFTNFKVELPFTTRLLIAVANFFENYGLYAIGGFFILVVFVLWLVKRKAIKPFTHYLILHTPVIKNISRHLNLSIFGRTLSVLMTSGVTIDDAVKICGETIPNNRYKIFLADVHNNIKAGDTLTETLKSRPDLFPETDIQIINVGEESGTLSDSLSYIASIHEEEVDSITKNLSTILEPLLLVIIGLMVGTLALSIIAPIYSITGSFRR